MNFRNDSLLISIPDKLLYSKEKKSVFCHAKLLHHYQLYIYLFIYFRKENNLKFMSGFNLNQYIYKDKHKYVSYKTDYLIFLDKDTSFLGQDAVLAVQIKSHR